MVRQTTALHGQVPPAHSFEWDNLTGVVESSLSVEQRYHSQGFRDEAPGKLGLDTLSICILLSQPYFTGPNSSDDADAD